MQTHEPESCYLTADHCLHSGASHFYVNTSSITAEHGLAVLQSAPVMCELSTWSDWGVLYSPVLGPLQAFINQHQHQLQFKVLEVPGGGLLKLPACQGHKLDLQQMRTKLQQAIAEVRTT